MYSVKLEHSNYCDVLVSYRNAFGIDRRAVSSR